MGGKDAYLLCLFEERLYGFDKLVLVPVILLLRLKVLDILRRVSAMSEEEWRCPCATYRADHLDYGDDTLVGCR